MVLHKFKYYGHTRQYVAEESLATLWIVLLETLVIVAAYFLILFVPSTIGE